MLLVLGKPGSGCSTFLKVLANQHSGYKAVEGEISYDGLSPAYMRKHYRGDLGYSPEDDIHLPMLTVRQTLVGRLGQFQKVLLIVLFPYRLSPLQHVHLICVSGACLEQNT